ncbi:hypothetical protein D9M70_606350 [compost metagenome]
MQLRAGRAGNAVRRPAVNEVGGFGEVGAGLDVPVLRSHDVVELAVVGVHVLADGARDVGPALDGQGTALAEIVLHINNNQGA